ncbi:MAG: hypothetical protein ACPGVG_08715 [Mycobacterium sp.]
MFRCKQCAKLTLSFTRGPLLCSAECREAWEVREALTPPEPPFPVSSFERIAWHGFTNAAKFNRELSQLNEMAGVGIPSRPFKKTSSERK